jgi:hypothetical protein
MELPQDAVTAENQQTAAPPAVVSSAASTTTSNQSSHTVDLPASIVSGNLLLAFFACDGSRTVQWPAGWTEHPEMGALNFRATLSCAYRLADGGEGASITVTTSGTERAAHQVYQIENAADPTVTPPEFTTSAGSGPEPYLPINTVTAGVNTYMWFAVFAADVIAGGNSVLVYPAGYSGGVETNPTNTSGSVLLGASRKVELTNSESPSAYLQSASEEWVSTTVAVHPSGQAGGTPSQVAVPVVDFTLSPQTVQADQVGGGGTNPIIDIDCSSYATDAALHAAMGTVTTGNVRAEPGVGARYDFQERSTLCADQSLSSVVYLPAGTTEYWLEFKGRFSANWSNANPNCTSPQPDYKWVLMWLKNNPLGGRRFDLKVGTSNSYWSCLPPGWATYQNAPLSVCQPGRGGNNPMPTTAIWDNNWHTIQIHQKIEASPEKATYQCKIDDIDICSYSTGYSQTIGLAGNSIDYLSIGANRNLGATELMQLWWDDIKVWTADPGHMTFAPISAY